MGRAVGWLEVMQFMSTCKALACELWVYLESNLKWSRFGQADKQNQGLCIFDVWSVCAGGSSAAVSLLMQQTSVHASSHLGVTQFTKEQLL